MIGAVVLAAGSSRRYGARPKLLARLAGRTVIEHSLDALHGLPVRPVVVVTGRARRRIEPVIRNARGGQPGLRLVHNPAYRQGMASSLQCGLAALPRHCHGALVCLGDMPDIEPRLVARLCATWHAGLDYVRPVGRGLPGHPVIVSRRLFPAIAALEGDRGAKTVLDAVPRARYRLIAARKAHGRDIDTPAALRRAAMAHRRRQTRGSIAKSSR